MKLNVRNCPREREVKFTIRSSKLAKETALALGASIVGRSHQMDRYLMNPCRKTNLAREALRLRHEGTDHRLTYKGPRRRSAVTDRPEIECTIGDPLSMEEILTRLGFRKLVDVRKVRNIYELQNFRICIDVVQDLGSFSEIEYCREGRKLTRKITTRMTRLARELGAVGPRISRSYPEMLLEKEKRSLRSGEARNASLLGST